MSRIAALSQDLAELLGLEHPPVGVSLSKTLVTMPAAAVAAQPAGCCFWAPAETLKLQTTPHDHAHCSVGSFTHGLISLHAAASAQDTAALVASGWVTAADLESTPSLPFAPATITYEPLAQAEAPDVVLIRLTPLSLMTLQAACPRLSLVAKPQCQIVPRAFGGRVSVSPGCAVSRVRADLPAGELTCALPASMLASIVDRLRRTTGADRAVAAYAAADRASFTAEQA
ncbi:hypothetical protein D3874_17840 [Oleomonas cavernae]|uniref:DUF169 domain-containing protein n=1 Tax=Oleomonas cavernae TaxID=2320859 RepID=A0A418WF39_9PROT|nr:DUF169 domain-containing protein [Oleomonas cavernae]RJF88624.1 hypothetical protein D3874_17840 [Oleomonas cavernae]